MSEDPVWPTDIRIDRPARTLTITFDDGVSYLLDAEYLRISSPSAEVQGHGPSTRALPGGKALVGLTGAEPIGNYAIRLRFDDGHGSGLYTWSYLRQLGAEREARMADYLRELAAKGLSRHR